MKKLLSRRVLQRVAGVAGVAALAVTSAFVAGALAGGDPAPEATSEPWAGAASSGSETVTVPVLAPSATGPDAPAPPADGTAEGDDTAEPLASEVTGTVEVALPPSGDLAAPEPAASASPEASAGPSAATGPDGEFLLALAPEVVASLAGLAEASDPAGLPGVSVLDAGGDPCATGAEATGCPEGVRSTVLASTDLPPLFGYTVTRPSVGEAPSWGVACPAVETGDDGVRFAVGTNLPVELEIQYWPEGRPEDARRILTWTSDEDRERFEANPPPPTGPAEILTHCTTLDGLEPGVAYEVHSVLTADSGEELVLDDVARSDAQDGRPPSRVLTLAQNVIFASLAHRPEEQAELVAFEVAPEDDLDCAATGPRATRQPLPRLTGPTVTEVPREDLQRGGYDTGFRQRTSSSFLAPEGAQVLVCLTALDDTRASFEGPAASRESVVLSTPDRLVPVISWYRATVHPDHGIERLRLGVATRGAGECAQLTRDPRRFGRTFEIEAPTGGTLCDQWDLDGTSGPAWGLDPVIWARVDGNGGSYTAQAVLPVAGRACSAVCPLPDVEWYTLSLERPLDDGALCGSSFGGCDEPTPRAAGSALVRVEWVQGRTNGQADWQVGPLVQHVGAPVAAELPQLDTDLVPAFDPAAGAIVVDLRTDRPAAYRAELRGDCAREDEVTLLEGRTEGLARLSFGGVCGGTAYEVAVTLTDDAGRSAVYGPDHVPPRRWATSLRTPGFAAVVRGSLSVRQGDGAEVPGGPTVWLEPVSLRVGGVELTPDDYRDGHCGGTAVAVLLDQREADLADQVRVQAEVVVRDGGGAYDPGRVHQRCPARSEPHGDSRTVVVDGLVPLDDLRSGEGVDVTARDASGAVEVRVRLALAN